MIKTFEQHIKNTDNPLDDDNNNPPAHPYQPVTSSVPTESSYHDLNILADPSHHKDKVNYKDCSLRDINTHNAGHSDTHRPDYTRSVSAPPNCPTPYKKATAPPEDCNVVMEEEYETGNGMEDETSPLHISRAHSLEFNNLVV